VPTAHPVTHEVQFLTVHGHRRAFVKVGQGPVLLLLHGLACDHTTWNPVIDRLARRYTVIAPDLLGHGLSDKPRADYTLGGYANGMRDLLTLLGIDKATVVGHSFGGGVAMQFAYQFPERTERMMLVAPGGLGPEVTPMIKLIQAPG
jgi:pimeloyl-ACP methyl ester carboxylesterase